MRSGTCELTRSLQLCQDVGERWYPDLLRQIRQQQAQDVAAKGGSNIAGATNDKSTLDSLKQQGQPIQAH